jgi:hypothetical protein
MILKDYYGSNFINEVKKRSTMEKNSTSFANAYFDMKRKEWKIHLQKKKQKIIPSEQLHLSQIHQHILPAFQVTDQKTR